MSNNFMIIAIIIQVAVLAVGVSYVIKGHRAGKVADLVPYGAPGKAGLHIRAAALMSTGSTICLVAGCIGITAVALRR